ncbi:nitrogenase vanadium-iron protein beta chain [Methylomusa anaerophila]|uniref:Nitrogenase vanadium-iron protein beta chain n=2 Tax=Methylomusa anaerophila TaxID=1930071 RepID=A0A348AFE7_9FIRM|nr:nitrogenase vanadium-iron protein beta chain [Methylomusa anaerophila]
MIAVTGCTLFGAYRTAASVRDAAVLIHSTIGCSWGTMAFHIPSRLQDVRQASSVLYEEDVIFGGARSLRQALAHSNEQYENSPVIFVITGCVAEIMADDVERIIATVATAKKIVLFKAAGFKGNMAAGMLHAMKTLIDTMTAKPVQQTAVNLIGILADDFKADADLAEIRRLLGKEVEINAVFPYDNYAAVSNVPAAALNIVFPGFEAIGDYLAEKFGTPQVVVDYPYGLEGSRRFAAAVAAALSLRLGSHIGSQERRATENLQAAYDYIRQLYALPVAVGGDTCRARALQIFLRQELGMQVLAAGNDSEEQPADFAQQVVESNAVILFGSSFDRKLAERHGLALIRYTYPVFDSISISNRGYAGFNGAVNLVEELINAVMAMEYRRKGLYDLQAELE